VGHEPIPAEVVARPQLGDVVPLSVDGTEEARRTSDGAQALWERNYAPGTPQASFAARFGLALATINDHEIGNNYSLNWHGLPFGTAASLAEATLFDRVAAYSSCRSTRATSSP